MKKIKVTRISTAIKKRKQIRSNLKASMDALIFAMIKAANANRLNYSKSIFKIYEKMGREIMKLEEWLRKVEPRIKYTKYVDLMRKEIEIARKRKEISESKAEALLKLLSEK